MHPLIKSHILLYSNDLSILHGFQDNMHVNVNTGRKSAILNFVELTIFKAYLSLKPHILFIIMAQISGMHGFSDITHIEVNSGCKSAIFNKKYKFVRACPSLKPHIVFHCKGIARFPYIRQIKKKIADSLPFWPPRPRFCQMRAHFPSSSQLLLK